MTVVNWIDWDTSGGPGIPRFVSVPDAHSTSSFGDFVFASSAATAQYECSTSGDAFAPCASVYRAWPLQAGNQRLALRTVSLTGQRSSTVIVYDWVVLVTVAAGVDVIGLIDGPHQQQVRLI